MKSIDRYKAMIEDVGHLLFVFGNIDKYTTIQEKGWTLDHIHQMQVKVMNYANIAADQIKDELIGDGDEAKFIGRIKTAFFEFGADPNFVPSYFPVFDEAMFELPSKDYPDRNKETIATLSVAFGQDTLKVMVSVKTMLEWANTIVSDVRQVLDDVCKFVGYNPEQPEPKQLSYNLPDTLNTKRFVCIMEEAIKRGWIKTDGNGGLGWLGFDGTSKGAKFGYLMAVTFGADYKVNGNNGNTIPFPEIEKLFNISRLERTTEQVFQAQKPQKWRTAIDEMIETALSTSN